MGNTNKDKSEESFKKISENGIPSRPNLIQEKSSVNASMSEMNATKKWTELRETWAKEK
jgi:hypothetical protein